MADDTKFKPQKEINRLKSQIKKLEKEKQVMLPAIGQAAYSLFLEGNLTDPPLVERCRQVKSLDEQIEQCDSRIEELKMTAEQMKSAPALRAGVCPGCGAAIDPGARFCGSCGAAIAPPAPAAPVAAAACGKCGSPLQAGSRFCSECGEPATATVPPPPPPAPSAAAAPPPSAPAPPAAAPPAPDTEAPGTAAGRKCPGCGALVEEADASFCGECGNRL